MFIALFVCIAVSLYISYRFQKPVAALRNSVNSGMPSLPDGKIQYIHAGYSSEKTLLTISLDFIKVDREIVRDIHTNPDKRAIMEYIVNHAAPKAASFCKGWLGKPTACSGQERAAACFFRLFAV